MTRISFVFLALVVGASPSSMARAQQPQSDVEVPSTAALPSASCSDVVPGACVEVESSAQHLVLRLRSGQHVLELQAPAAFSANAAARVEALHGDTSLQGGLQAWRVDINEADRSFSWLVEQRRQELHLMWYSAGGDNREQLRVEDLDGDGDLEIVVGIPSGTAGRCGSASPWLAPRVYDEQSETFRPVSLRVSAADARLMSPAPEALQDQFPQDAAPVFVSSNAQNGLAQSWGPPPDALTDNDPSTAWMEAAAGSGTGQFVTFRTLPQVGVYGLQVHVGDAQSVRRLLVALPDGETWVTPELPAGSSTWAFPESVSGSCLQVVVLQVDPDAEHATLAELNLLTELDRRPVDTALDLYVLPALLRTTTPMERGILQDVIASAGDAAIPALLQAIEEAEGDEQALLLDTLMQLEIGPDAMLARFDTLEVDLAGYRRVAAEWPTGRTLPADWLERFQQARPAEQAGWLLLLTRVQPEFSIDDLWPMLDLTHEPTRLALSDYLTSFELPGQLLVSDAAATENPERRRLVYSSSLRRIRQDEVPLDDDALSVVRTTATTSTDGAVARYAVAILGEAGDTTDVTLLQGMLNEDPEPVMRMQAADALSILALRGFENAATAFDSALRHSDPGVRLHAAAISARNTALEVSRSTLADRLTVETWPETQRQVAVAALGRARNADDVAAVLQSLVSWSASTASAVIRHLPDDPALVRCEDLVPVAEAHPDSEPVAVAVALAMGRCQGAEATEWLRARWRGEASSERLSQAALESAVLRGDHEAVERGVAMLGSTEPAVRRNGALALHRSTRDVHEALTEALREETDPAVVRALRTALGLPSDDATMPSLER